VLIPFLEFFISKDKCDDAKFATGALPSISFKLLVQEESQRHIFCIDTADRSATKTLKVALKEILGRIKVW